MEKAFVQFNQLAQSEKISREEVNDVNWFIQAIKKYAVLEGRARRKEYWYFILFYFLFYFVLIVVDGITGSFDKKEGLGFLSAIFSLALLIPSIAVSIRRLHYTDRSG